MVFFISCIVGFFTGIFIFHKFIKPILEKKEKENKKWK